MRTRPAKRSGTHPSTRTGKHTAQRIRFVSSYPEMLPPLIHKDVGQIPYYLGRELDWECKLVSWSRDSHAIELPDDYEQYASHVSLGTFVSRARRNIAFLDYLRKHARNIDVLLIYHLTSDALAQATLYKLLNPSGFAILKLDMDHRGLQAFSKTASNKQKLLLRLLASAPIDLATIETQTMKAQLDDFFAARGIPLSYFPIGISRMHSNRLERRGQEKQNIILTAGRLGVEQKNNELLLEAIRKLADADCQHWEFWFVGTRTAEFDQQLSTFKVENPAKARSIVVRDFVSSREELAELYARCKVYCLTSRWESFAIVLAEAASYGCYIVSTKVGAACDLTDNGLNGSLVDVGDADSLSKALAQIMRGEVDVSKVAERVRQSVEQRLSWPNVIRSFGETVMRSRN